jgi:hypothetical protein
MFCLKVFFNSFLCQLIFIAEAGDFQPDNQPDQYISDYQLVPNQVCDVIIAIVSCTLEQTFSKFVAWQ